MRRKIIAVVGDASIDENSIKHRMAFETGRAIIDCGFRLQCGGLSGAMRSACMGAHASKNYKDGDTIGILPTFDINTANEFVDIAIPTGLDMYRNTIVSNASAVITIGGGAGTLCEVANAWTLKRLIIAYSNCEGTSALCAGRRMDVRIRYPDIPEDMVYPATTVDEAMKLLVKYIDKYTIYHTGITPGH
ncbi:MAG: hypothetical protein LBF68_06915 [Christensenellaceae bacterium]|jgi:uncharacterized protein (TIGR00725 family)|nr:hypothetical protein [Christensenellaceae bacterium]